MNEKQLTAERYLMRIRIREREIQNKEIELDALRYKAGGVGGIDYSKDKIQSSSGDYMEMIISDIIKLSEEIENERYQYEQMKVKTYALIRRLDKPEHRAVLEWLYINGLSIVSTSKRMNLSERSTYYLRNEALELFGFFINP